jgi:intracellular sulfur oxidation DsrE/DsrF family protein
MNTAFKRLAAALALPLVMGWSTTGIAAKAEEGGHKIVIQVSTGDEATQTMALNNAVNLQKEYGTDNVEVDVVAYGPGLSLLTREGSQAQRVQDLAMQGIHFDACGNTMRGIEKKTGKLPALVEGVNVVPAGVGRIMELQEQGYAYVRP